MAKVCMVTGKGTARGNIVAHCNKKIKRTYKANVQWKRIWLESEKRFVRLRISAHGLRIIDKVGIENVLAGLRDRNEVI